MSEGVNVQRPLTRRELREQERRAEQQRIAAEQAARAAAAADSATPVESASVAPAAQDAETASVDARTQAAAKAQGQQFTSRRERREAERAAALAEFNQRAEQAQIAAQQVATQSPELFADRAAKTKSSVAAQVQIHRVAINPIPNVASRPATAPVFAAADEAATETSAQPAAVVATNTAAPAGIPVAPADEPKIEFAAAFASGGSLKATRRVRHSDGGRRASRVGGSMVAFGLIAGTVALGTGSAAAISAAAAADEGAAEVGEPNADQPAPQTLKVSQEETVSVAATRRSEVTAVTSIGTAHAANLAAGVKLPDSNAYTNDITANVQWPFPQGVQITDPYGPRVSPFGGGSSWHGGVDFTPGEGTPIGSIADGRVSYISESGTTYGIYVEVEHVINGERVTSQYAHLQPGSISVKVGDVVQVGDQIAKVGNTGASTGPHLHLETLIDGGTVDPMYFLKKLNVAGVDVKVPEEVPTGGVALGAERRGVEESHKLVDETFGN
ncbi:M23 family metallopeptidase [Gulosibacter hominis]|uniref:M23 family metallopeptidase n=1 Tax=Gulosibacter hominis TaxID=2770504 RepID=UPI00191B3AB9|nr:M23 family metallopeptidase [Gulosibacter hominis]